VKTISGLAADTTSQAVYHRQLFDALFRWDQFWAETLDMTGDEGSALALGLDQMGHFGPRGVSLVVDRMVARTSGALTRVLEVGSGFGGALRQVGRELRAREIDAYLVGVEFVAEHCANAAAINRSLRQDRPVFVQADAQRLPFAAASFDAVFAAGSASYFSSTADVLAECGRVLRPGGVLVMTEEVGIRPAGGPSPGELFLRYHPEDVFHPAEPEQRRADVAAAGLTVESYETLVRWAVPLLRQRVHALRFLGHCARRMFGANAYDGMVGTLTSAADEYERGAVEPVVMTARRAAEAVSSV
jgi:SAM-dependent methyltransferase